MTIPVLVLIVLTLETYTGNLKNLTERYLAYVL